MKKRVLSLIIAVVMVASFIIALPASSEGEYNYDEAIDTLGKFGVIGDDFKTGESVTFGEFIGMAMKLTGMTSSVSKTESPFSDVTSTDRYYSEIVMASDMKIVSGWGNSLLGYGEALSLDRAAKVLVAILGYDPVALAKGGYPGGYLTVANEKGILDNCDISSGHLTWDQAAQLVYNCLEIEIFQQTSYPDGSYATVEGETPLLKWMKIEKAEGKVTANSVTSTDGSGECDNGVCIDAVRFNDGELGLGRYIGYPVTVYYKELSSANRIILDFEIDDSVTEYEISANDIDDETIISQVIYWDEDKKQSLAIESLPTVIYNFKKYDGELNSDMLKPTNGKVVFVDTDSNRSADLIIINESLFYSVKKVSTVNGIVYDMYDLPPLRLYDEDVVSKIIKDGKEVAIDELKEEEVLAVTKSADGKYIEAEISMKAIKGQVEEIGDGYFVLKGMKFKIVTQNEKEFENLNPGDNIMALLTSTHDAVAFVEQADDGYEYGYVTDVFTKETFADGKYAALRIFTEQDGFVTVRTSKNLVIDDEKYDAESTAGYFKNGVIINHQLIKFKRDNDGYISHIETACDNTVPNGGTGYNSDDFTLDFKNYTSYTYKFSANTGILATNVNLSTAVAFNVPPDSMWIEMYKGERSVSDLESVFSAGLCMTEWKTRKLLRIFRFTILTISLMPNMW